MDNGDNKPRPLWREVLGTIIGVLPFVLGLLLAIVNWGTKLDTEIAVQQQRISTLEIGRADLIGQLTKIADKLDYLSIQIARTETQVDGNHR